MLTRRVIPCLDVKDNRVVKGVNFLNLQDAGDPVELGARYSDEGADELVFLDITATIRSRETIVELVEKVAEKACGPPALRKFRRADYTNVMNTHAYSLWSPYGTA